MILSYYHEWPNQIRKIWYHEDNDLIGFHEANKKTIDKMNDIVGYKKIGMIFDENLQPALAWKSQA